MKGFIAQCKHNKWGLVLDYKDGVYYGIKISVDDFGKNWQSKDPRPFMHIENLVVMYQHLTNFFKKFTLAK